MTSGFFLTVLTRLTVFRILHRGEEQYSKNKIKEIPLNSRRTIRSFAVNVLKLTIFRVFKGGSHAKQISQQ